VLKILGTTTQNLVAWATREPRLYTPESEVTVKHFSLTAGSVLIYMYIPSSTNYISIVLETYTFHSMCIINMKG
jgi:hypothetical protein